MKKTYQEIKRPVIGVGSMAVWTDPIRMKFRMEFRFSKKRANKIHYEISWIIVTSYPSET